MSGYKLVLYLLSICLSSAGAWFVSRYGHRLELLDEPNERSSHRAVTPKGGGIGILAGFTVSALLMKVSVFLWIPAALLSVISFAGDRYHLAPLIRLLFQFAASFIFLFGLWKGHPLSSAGYLIIIPLSVYIVGTTNYFNFMDGINGIAGITGLVGFGLLAVFAHSKGIDTGIEVLSITLGLGCAAFLPFNLPKANVFMGDVGSILLGFVFAAMVFMLADNATEFLCLSLFLFPFYADEITTELMRLKDGQKLWTPHRRHLYQILANEYSIAHWKVSLGYGLAQLFVGASSLYYINFGLSTVLSIIFLYLVAFSVISLALRKKLTPKAGL
ncbi:glycosyltransferase family 4 protein [bacterium]|nr:glycosyltransferase family 4 protein [bacterium]